MGLWLLPFSKGSVCLGFCGSRLEGLSHCRMRHSFQKEFARRAQMFGVRSRGGGFSKPL